MRSIGFGGVLFGADGAGQFEGFGLECGDVGWGTNGGKSQGAFFFGDLVR